MALIHIVFFQFKPTCTHAQVIDVCERMLALKDKCIHSETKKPYIKSSMGGRDNSPEGHSYPFTHGFVVEFENAQDRDYYLSKDPAHLEFVASLEGVLQNPKILDFEPGKL